MTTPSAAAAPSSNLTVLTRAQPTTQQRADVVFALPIVREIRALNVGRSLAIKEREILAVEAVEGTEAVVARAGSLCRQGRWTLIIYSLEGDISPAVGAALIQRMKPAGVKCLAIDATAMRTDEEPAIIAAADAAKIAVLKFHLD